MRFRYIVEVEVERSTGKFASRDEIGSQIEEALTDADPGDLAGDAGGEYNTINWEVSEEA